MSYRSGKNSDGDTIYTGVLTSHAARELLDEIGLEYAVELLIRTVKRIGVRAEKRVVNEIHIYFKDVCGYDVAYYTPDLHNVLVFKEPRYATFQR